MIYLKFRVILTINYTNRPSFTTSGDTDFIFEDIYNYAKDGMLTHEDVYFYLVSSQEGRLYLRMRGLTENDVNSEKITIVDIIPIQSGGKYKLKNHKRRTPEKVEVNKKVRAVYVGPKGGKYIRKNGKYVSLKKIL
jgi:hypothetical protein